MAYAWANIGGTTIRFIISFHLVPKIERGLLEGLFCSFTGGVFSESYFSEQGGGQKPIGDLYLADLSEKQA